MVLNQKGPDYVRQTNTTEMHDEQPLNANDYPFNNLLLMTTKNLFLPYQLVSLI